MHRRKKIIFFIGIIILLIIIVISIIIKNGENKSNSIKIMEEEHENYLYYEENPASVVNGNKPEPLQFETVYLAVKDSLKKYLQYCKEDNSRAITAIIDKQYIEDKKTENNTIRIPNTEINQLDSLYIEDMYALSGSQYYEFYIKYYIDNKETYIELNQDRKNVTFSIVPLNKNKYEKILKTVVNGRTGKEKEIQRNNFNSYTPIAIKEDEIAEVYLEDLKEKLLYNPNRLYDMLDSKFREKKFTDYSQFNTYISQNKERIKNVMINKFSVKRDGTNRTYTCTDTKDKTYTFKITSAMKYTVLFDEFSM